MFSNPVPKSTPFYYTLIKMPMDFSTIRRNIMKTPAMCPYLGHDGMERLYEHVALISDNCREYNQEGSEPYAAAVILEQRMNALKPEAARRWALETTSSSSSTVTSVTSIPTTTKQPVVVTSPTSLSMQIDPVRDVATFVADHRFAPGDFDPYYYMDGFEKDHDTWDRAPYDVRDYERLEQYDPVINQKDCMKKLETTKTGCSAPADCLPDGAALKLDFQALREKRPLIHSCDAPWPPAAATTSSSNSSTSSTTIATPDLIRTNTWGIDAKTRRRLLWVLERHTALSEQDRFEFVGGVLLATINRQVDADAHDIRTALCSIEVNSTTVTGNAKHRAAATSLLRYLARSEVANASSTSNNSSSSSSSRGRGKLSNSSTLPRFTLDNFRIHPKGQGIVCARKNGISPYTFVSEYIGELYPSWRWFEKTDAVKTMQKTLKKETALPDFYNITLERHSDDEKGFGVLFVDPIARGNFASRLSHSCNPNCATVVIACDGRCVILCG